MDFERPGVKMSISLIVSFSTIRKKRFKNGRPSGGVTVFVKYNFIENGTVTRIFHDLEECVVLNLDRKSLGI